MLSRRQQECLNGIGIRQWVERSEITIVEEKPAEAIIPESIPGLFKKPPESEVIQQPVPVEIVLPRLKLDNWGAINEAIQQCTACELSANCTQKVPGVGDPKADLMIIGEGPGHDEDIKGEPFVGRSGVLLDKMLATIGLARNQVFITNIVKCRPPNNRDPHVDEINHCSQFLSAQIEQIAPRIILCVGRVSAHSLLNNSDPVGKLINGIHVLPNSDTPVKVTYHPAYLLRNPASKAIAWNDLKTLRRILAGD